MLLLGAFSGASFAAGDAEKGRYEWEYTCQHCHGTPQPSKAAAFSDYGATANRLSVYANDPAAITKAATLGYTIPEGNTNDKEAPGGSTSSPMGTWAGDAPNRLGLGTTPTQYTINFSAYFATFFAAPGAPSIGTVTPGNGQATVSFTAPKSELAITGYTVTANPGGFAATGAASPITVTGLANGTAYTFTVSAASNAGAGKPSASSGKTVIAAAGGSTAGQGAAAPVIPAVTVPPVAVPKPALAVTAKAAPSPAPAANTAPQAPAANAPYIKFAKAGNASARIFFNVQPDANITGYTVTALSNGAPAGIAATGSKSPITITGLTNGTDYTFTLTANVKKGPGLTSAPSSTVTPLRLLGD
jgi:hypothetical protein